MKAHDKLIKITAPFSNFQPLEVVDRGSETQLQVAEKLKIISSLGKY